MRTVLSGLLGLGSAGSLGGNISAAGVSASASQGLPSLAEAAELLEEGIVRGPAARHA